MKVATDNGIVIGIVKNLEDPDNLGRVKVAFPTFEDQESYWARLVTLMAGPDRGVFFRPEVDDEVLVAFEHGDIRRPYILGAVWSKVDKPPADDGKAKENNWRFIKTRSGHIVKLDDTKGKEKIEIIDKTGNNFVTIDTAENTITVNADKDVIVKAKSNVYVEAGSDVEIKGTNVKVTASSNLELEGSTVKIKASASGEFDGGGMLDLKAGMININ